MAVCPICAKPSAGKRITYNNLELRELCLQCASYSVCLISPNVEARVKQNAVSWADVAIMRNADKSYIVRCLENWKRTAQAQLPLQEAVPEQQDSQVYGVNSNEIDIDATIRGFGSGEYAAVLCQQEQEAPQEAEQEQTLPEPEESVPEQEDGFSVQESLPVQESFIEEQESLPVQESFIEEQESFEAFTAPQQELKIEEEKEMQYNNIQQGAPSPVQNYNGYQQGAPAGYSQPQAPVFINPARASKKGWTKALKILITTLAIIAYIGIIGAGVVFGVEALDYEPLLGILVIFGAIVVGALAVLLVFGFGMMLIEMSMNLAKANDSINELTAEIKRLNK